MAIIPTPQECAHEILSIFVTKFNRRPGEYLPINSFYEEMDRTTTQSGRLSVRLELCRDTGMD